MSGEHWPTQLTQDEIDRMKAEHARFEEAIDAGHLLPEDGRSVRAVPESFAPDVATYVTGDSGTTPAERTKQ